MLSHFLLPDVVQPWIKSQREIPGVNPESSINLTCLFLDCGTKLDCPDRTHAHSETSQTGLLLWGLITLQSTFDFTLLHYIFRLLLKMFQWSILWIPEKRKQPNKKPSWLKIFRTSYFSFVLLIIQMPFFLFSKTIGGIKSQQMSINNSKLYRVLIFFYVTQIQWTKVQLRLKWMWHDWKIFLHRGSK